MTTMLDFENLLRALEAGEDCEFAVRDALLELGLPNVASRFDKPDLGPMLKSWYGKVSGELMHKIVRCIGDTGNGRGNIFLRETLATLQAMRQEESGRWRLRKNANDGCITDGNELERIGDGRPVMRFTRAAT